MSRHAAGFAVLVAVVLAGCTHTVPGRPTAAADLGASSPTGTPPTATPPPAGAPDPSGSTGPRRPAPSDPAPSVPGPTGAGPTRTGPTAVPPQPVTALCRLLDPAAVARVFRMPVTLAGIDNDGCQILARSGDSMVLGRYARDTLNSYRSRYTSDTTVGGHPALSSATNRTLLVACTTNPAAPCVAAAFYIGLPNGPAVAAGVLTQLVPRL